MHLLSLTFDQIQGRFRETPTQINRHAYQLIAISYWMDDMIGDDTLLGALREIRESNPRR